ncbi:MAG: energy-coupling factor transporter transmembrane protein EcfT [Actinomycetia bacterium]|nr:energy-coupling factor transporter transmembrane protein EcfT [Actinomycetes bacterium]
MRKALAYFKEDSFFHEMDPTFKMLWIILISISAFLKNTEPDYSSVINQLIIYILVIIIAFTLGTIGLLRYIKSISLFVPPAFFILIYKALFYPYTTTKPFTSIYELSFIKITYEGLFEGIGVALRILILTSLSIIFILTTEPKKMVQSLMQVAKVPYRIGYTLYTALRFIPLIYEEYKNITNAHLVRGVGFSKIGLHSKISLFKSSIVPLIISGIRRAQEVSIAMDSRGFGAYKKRTVVDKIKVRNLDIVFVSFTFFLLISYIFFLIYYKI